LCVFAFSSRDLSHILFKARHTEVAAQLLSSIIRTTYTTTLSSFFLYTFIFGAVRAIFLPVLFHVPILGLLFRPFGAYYFLGGPWTLLMLFDLEVIRHIGRTFFFGAVFISILTAVEILFVNAAHEVRL
jgi:hypothetical protein